MFDAIAPRYELVNKLMTFGLDTRWRRRAVSDLRLARGSVVLDVAAGTGDFARELVRQGLRRVATDLSFNMLHTATAVGERVQADASCLPFRSGELRRTLPAATRFATSPTSRQTLRARWPASFAPADGSRCSRWPNRDRVSGARAFASGSVASCPSSVRSSRTAPRTTTSPRRRPTCRQPETIAAMLNRCRLQLRSTTAASWVGSANSSSRRGPREVHTPPRSRHWRPSACARSVRATAGWSRPPTCCASVSAASSIASTLAGGLDGPTDAGGALRTHELKGDDGPAGTGRRRLRGASLRPFAPGELDATSLHCITQTASGEAWLTALDGSDHLARAPRRRSSRRPKRPRASVRSPTSPHRRSTPTTWRSRSRFCDARRSTRSCSRARSSAPCPNRSTPPRSPSACGSASRSARSTACP